MTAKAKLKAKPTRPRTEPEMTLVRQRMLHEIGKLAVEILALLPETRGLLDKFDANKPKRNRVPRRKQPGAG